MEAKKLTFDSGLRAYDVNGYTIHLNPTDVETAKRITAAIEEFGKIQARYSELGDQAMPADLPAVNYEKAVMEEDPEELQKAEQVSGLVRERLNEFDKLNAELSQGIDALFGEGAAAGIFQGMSLTAFAGGLPVWLNFLTAVLGEFEESAKVAAEAEEENLRALTAKYTEKYTATRQIYRNRRRKRRRH